MTVRVMSSSGRDVIREERRNHCRPAINTSRQPSLIVRSTMEPPNIRKYRGERAHTPAADDLRDAVLLVQVALLVDLVEETALAVPAGDGVEELDALLLRAGVAHLDDDKRVLVGRAGGEQHVGVELARGALDAVAEVLDQRGGRRAVEAAGHNTTMR